MTDALRANQLFNHMNGGIGFNTTAINDATADADHGQSVERNTVTRLQRCARISDSPPASSMSTTTGVAYAAGGAASDTIIVGTTADNETLAHEFGHALSLADANIVTTNLMIERRHRPRQDHDRPTVSHER